MKKKTQKKKNMTIDGLAVIVAKGFDAVDKRFDAVDKRFDAVDKRFDSLEERLTNKINGLDQRIDDLALNRATRDELRIIQLRVDRLEKKTGLKR